MKAEKAKLDMEGCHLSVVREDMLSGESQGRQVPRSSTRHFDVNNLHLVPQFNERDPDTFFCCLARKWPDADCALKFQCVLSGKAQEAYSALSLEHSSSYAKGFRSWERKNGQM